MNWAPARRSRDDRSDELRSEGPGGAPAKRVDVIVVGWFSEKEVVRVNISSSREREESIYSEKSMGRVVGTGGEKLSCRGKNCHGKGKGDGGKIPGKREGQKWESAWARKGNTPGGTRQPFSKGKKKKEKKKRPGQIGGFLELSAVPFPMNCSFADVLCAPTMVHVAFPRRLKYP